jgi:hypothetical protein
LEDNGANAERAEVERAARGVQHGDAQDQEGDGDDRGEQQLERGLGAVGVTAQGDQADDRQ